MADITEEECDGWCYFCRGECSWRKKKATYIMHVATRNNKLLFAVLRIIRTKFISK